MTPEESRHLGEGIISTFYAWEMELPDGVRRMFGGDRARLLCGALLLPHVSAQAPPAQVARYAKARGMPQPRGTVSMPASAPADQRAGIGTTYVEIDSMELVLAATIVLVVDRLDARGRSEVVPEALRAGASIGLMLGLEVLR